MPTSRRVGGNLEPPQSPRGQGEAVLLPAQYPPSTGDYRGGRPGGVKTYAVMHNNPIPS